MERQEMLDERTIVKRILEAGIIEHDERNPRVFRAHLAHGSKFLDCFIDKERKTAGSIVERNSRLERQEHETTFLYRSLLAVLQGVANRLGEAVTYSFITENEKLIVWAQSEGESIFHWSNITIDENGLAKFTCLVEPTITPRKAERRKQTADATKFIWELREEFH